MTAFAAVVQFFQSLLRLVAPPARPTRLLSARRVRLFAATTAGSVAGALLLAAYYATLGLLPSAFSYPTTTYPMSAWAHRLDLAQFVGTLLHPPAPSPLTWWVGLAVLFGTLVGSGVLYALLLAWSLQVSDTLKGLVFGALLFLGLAFTITIANGVHPAIMRNALPDTGLFLLGWSPVATLQLISVTLLYGAVLGTLYRKFTIPK